jgi:hypothetical protein
MNPSRLVLLALLALLAAPAARAQVSTATPMKAAPLMTPLPVRAPAPVITPAPRPLPTPVVVLPATPKPIVTPIERKPILVELPEKSAYTLRPEAGEVKFGDGVHGKRPPRGGKPAATYRQGAGPMLPAVQKPGKLATQGPVMVSPLDDPRRSEKGELSDSPELQQLRLQDTMNRKSKAVTSLSNISKKQHDTSKAIIDKMK